MMLFQFSRHSMKRNTNAALLKLRQFSHSSTKSSSSFIRSNSQIISSSLLLVGVSVTGLAAIDHSTTTTKLEENVEKNKENKKEELFEGLEEDDDYSDLPEVDEPTTCGICLINRQGPCRKPWLRFERCIKDNPDDEEEKDGSKKVDTDDDEDIMSSSSSLLDKCSKVSYIWFNCLDKHRVTYTMITNKQYQPEIEAMEESYITKDIRHYDEFPKPPTIDISHYQQYQQAMFEQEEEVLEEENNSSSSNTPNKAENFVSGYVYFDIFLNLKDGIDKNDVKEIDVAYVKDQNNNVLGFDHFTHDKKNTEDGKQQQGELLFHIPSNTTTLTAYALYKKKNKKVEVKENKKAADDVVSEEEDAGLKKEEKEEEDDGILHYYTISNLLAKENMEDV